MKELKKYFTRKYRDYLLRYFHRFMPLTEEEIMGLLTYCEFRQYGKKELIVREGEVDNYLNMVVEGLVMKSIRVKKNEVIMQLATEGHMITSELSFLTQTPSIVTIRTLEPSILMSISYRQMQEALVHFPLGEKLGRMILEQMYIIKDERKFTWQAKDTRQRFLDYMEHHPHMLQRVPQKYLASYPISNRKPSAGSNT